MKTLSLTSRELEVLDNISRGYTTKEIAGILFLSAHTVITYRKTLMRKLKVENAPAMVRRGFEIGVLPHTTGALIRNN